MKISEIFKSGGKAFPSIEIVPPLNGFRKDELLATVGALMAYAPRYVNVTCHRDEVVFRPQPDGSFSRHLIRSRVSPVAVCAAVMAAFPVEIVPHLICAGHTDEDIRNQLSDYKFLGISNLLALRGDSMLGEKRFTPTPGGYAHAQELVAAVRNYEEGESLFSIGVAGYPEKHFEAPNPEADIECLRRKVDAGADYIITQMFFDNAVFYRFVERCRAAGIRVPIVPGLKPLSSARQLSLLPESFSIDIPQELTRAVSAAASPAEAYEIGTQWCIGQCRDLLAHGVPAVHFYTMGRTDNIAAVLRACF